jgi:sirohydrochlorin ferrochelatase
VSAIDNRQSAIENSPQTAIIIVDHGSRKRESNDMLLALVEMYRGHAGARFAIIEPAHMELAEPSIATAFDRCVARGAKRVVVMPYFLLPGRHWTEYIPRLTAEAAAKHPGVGYLVGAPLGLHPLIAEVIESRLEHCLAHAAGGAAACDVCKDASRCVMRGG